MALKDWKKIPYGYSHWENKSKSLIISESLLFVPFQKNLKKVYRVLVNDLPPNFNRYVDKSFDSMKEAIKFAKEYMKTH